jgi:hypothetical protein
MESSNRQSLRVLIQHLPGRHTAGRFPYLLVAYNGQTGKALLPSQHSSLQNLLQILRAAGISLHDEDLEIKDIQEPYILFAAEIELTAAQLSILGLKSQA